MIRAYGSRIVCGGREGRIKIHPCNMIRAYGSQWRLKKCQLLFPVKLKHAYFYTEVSGGPVESACYTLHG